MLSCLELQTPYFVTIILVRMEELVKSFPKVSNATAIKDLWETHAKVRRRNVYGNRCFIIVA